MPPDKSREHWYVWTRLVEFLACLGIVRSPVANWQTTKTVQLPA